MVPAGLNVSLKAVPTPNIQLGSSEWSGAVWIVAEALGALVGIILLCFLAYCAFPLYQRACNEHESKGPRAKPAPSPLPLHQPLRQQDLSMSAQAQWHDVPSQTVLMYEQSGIESPLPSAPSPGTPMLARSQEREGAVSFGVAPLLLSRGHDPSQNVGRAGSRIPASNPRYRDEAEISSARRELFGSRR